MLVARRWPGGLEFGRRLLRPLLSCQSQPSRGAQRSWTGSHWPSHPYRNQHAAGLRQLWPRRSRGQLRRAMQREPLMLRPDWHSRVEALGLDFHTADGKPYWWEAACYAFTAAEVDLIEEATEALHRLCLEAVDRI